MQASEENKYGTKALIVKNPMCQLVVWRFVPGRFEVVGEKRVTCISAFTHLYWVDIDGDGKEELLLLTMQPDPPDGQRLFIYKVSDNIQKIAEMFGYINDGDGVGIKWEKVDGELMLLTGLSPYGNGIGGLENMSVERRFQAYRWDKASNTFVPTEK